MNGTELWLVNLAPEGDGTARVMRVLMEPGAQVDEVLSDATTAWPGQVLDVVGPNGCSYLMCSTPPWYAQHPAG